ncbi:MarR family winged helix-turn-helix transcriptional regulator [Microbacterium sp. 1P10AE]|uniref:MarR family winged helix-turn-helix transcriptional regulator n=1 Tax=Microbacterium sp. 1P10AE TaxID=3132286 RepID=UPI0039A2C233
MSRYDVPAELPYAFLNDDDVRAWFAFMKVQLRLRYETNRQLRDDSGISLADYDVLVALTSEPSGTMTVSDLAIRIGAERSRVSHQSRRLAGDGLVDLTPNANDRRATDVTLTPAGATCSVVPRPPRRFRSEGLLRRARRGAERTPGQRLREDLRTPHRARQPAAAGGSPLTLGSRDSHARGRARCMATGVERTWVRLARVVSSEIVWRFGCSN